jgi:hypothetical protein
MAYNKYIRESMGSDDETMVESSGPVNYGRGVIPENKTNDALASAAITAAMGAPATATTAATGMMSYAPLAAALGPMAPFAIAAAPFLGGLFNKGTANVAGINPMKYNHGTHGVPTPMMYDDSTARVREATPLEDEAAAIREAYMQLDTIATQGPLSEDQIAAGMTPTPVPQPMGLRPASTTTMMDQINFLKNQNRMPFTDYQPKGSLPGMFSFIPDATQVSNYLTNNRKNTTGSARAQEAIGLNHGTPGIDPTIRIDPFVYNGPTDPIRIDPLVYGGPTDPRRFEGIYDGPTDPRRFEGIYDGPTDPNNFVFNGPMASPFTGSAFSDDLIYRNPAGTYRSYSPGNAGTLGGGKGMPVEIVPETPSNGYDMPAMDRRPRLPVGPRNFPFFGTQIPPVRDFDNLPFHGRIGESPLPPAAGESSFMDRMKEKFLKPYPSGDLDYLIPSLGGIAGPMSGGPSSNSEPSERRSSFMDKMKENFLRLSPYILDQVGPFNGPGIDKMKENFLRLSPYILDQIGPFSGPGGGVAGPMSGGPSSKKQLDSFKVEKAERRADELHDAKLYDMMMKRNKAD